MPTCNIGILVSGRGSNMLAIVRAIERKRIKGARVAVVISDKREAKALDSAMRHGLDAVWLDPAEAASRLDYDMRLLSPEFVEAFGGRIMNIHPSLLPSFPGLRAQEQALERGVKVSGCTVHFVVPEVDSGPIVLQRAVKVEEADTPESLAARILRQEHVIYPLAVRLFVEGRLKIEGRKVLIRGK